MGGSVLPMDQVLAMMCAKTLKRAFLRDSHQIIPEVKFVRSTCRLTSLGWFGVLAIVENGWYMR